MVFYTQTYIHIVRPFCFDDGKTRKIYYSIINGNSNVGGNKNRSHKSWTRMILFLSINGCCFVSTLPIIHTHIYIYIYRYTPLIWYTIHTTNWYGVEFIKCPVTLAMINEYFVHSFILFAISNLMVSVMAIAVFFFYTTLENMDAVLNLSYIVALKNCFSNILNVYIYAFCLGYAALHLLRME